jgi:hypothetical protein
MQSTIDGPCSSLFSALHLKGNITFSALEKAGISETMRNALKHAPRDSCVCWGIPFDVGDPILVTSEPVSVDLRSVTAPWLLFMHTTDIRSIEAHSYGPFATTPVQQLGEHIGNYVVVYSDNSEERVALKRRYQIGAFQNPWGELCFEAVGHVKPRPLPGGASESVMNQVWGFNQTLATSADNFKPWLNWIWGWENPYPQKQIVNLRLEPVIAPILLFAVSVGHVSSHPLRWQSRRKARIKLAEGDKFDPSLDEIGLLKHVRLDLGQVISAQIRLIYPNDTWEETYNNRIPETFTDEILVEYTAHPEAHLYLSNGKAIPLVDLEKEKKFNVFEVVPASDKTVTIRAIDRDTGKAVPVKLHVHGESGEYLAPLDRQRVPNVSWFQDYTVDFSHRTFKGLVNPSTEVHHCTYMPGEARIKLPHGKVYVEASKGFEVRPVRKVIEITSSTEEVVVELEKVLPWREKGWVTADTHVHFLSPSSALLEGAGEGVNVVNLLASQWGELMTNVGDFDGKTIFGSREAGGEGEYLVRVGTENRQHVLGHISLLGYNGDIITPLCTGGPAESAIGDPVETLLTEWAIRCKKQGGIVILPHYPNPRCENAVTIITGNVDGIEMTSWGDLYRGINPYSLYDWYRYLNCGYLVAAVGGTDKMTADTAVGTVRTYAAIGSDQEFTYEAWKEAIRKANTFVTYGPLLEFAVEGKPPGSWIQISANGGTVDVTWQVASATIPMARVELIVNGEIRESREVRPTKDRGKWSVKLKKSSWLALLIRAHYYDKPEIIAAHSSPVMVQVKGSPFMAAADALTILEQIEGALAYIDTVGTRADIKTYKRLRLVLTAAHRELHNRMHQLGHYHEHTPVKDHRKRR